MGVFVTVSLDPPEGSEMIVVIKEDDIGAKEELEGDDPNGKPLGIELSERGESDLRIGMPEGSEGSEMESEEHSDTTGDGGNKSGSAGTRSGNREEEGSTWALTRISSALES